MPILTHFYPLLSRFTFQDREGITSCCTDPPTSVFHDCHTAGDDDYDDVHNYNNVIVIIIIIIIVSIKQILLVWHKFNKTLRPIYSIRKKTVWRDGNSHDKITIGSLARLRSVVVGHWTTINTSRVRLPAAALPSSDPGQVVHTCPAPLKLRLYGAIEIWII